MSNDVAKLNSGRWDLEVLPGIGGAVSRLNYDGLDLLRPARPTPDHPLQTAAFPMIPYSGRIEHGMFSFESRQISLDRNFGDEPHSIHGQCWLNPWSVASTGNSTLVLERIHGGQDWPWIYEAAQRFTIDGDQLQLTLSLTNLDTRLMPAGLGWHPYFMHHPDVSLTASLKWLWPRDTSGLSQPPGPNARMVQLVDARMDDLALDDCFTVDMRRVAICWPGQNLTLVMTFEELFSHLIIYTPNDDFFCVEPASHAPNAVNHACDPALSGRRTLAPGETLSGSIILRPEVH